MKSNNMSSPSTVFLVVSLLILGCAYATTDEYSDLSYGIASFSGKLLDEVSKANKDKSVIESPISVLIAIFMMYLGAKGTTASELIKTIGVGKDQAHDQFTALTNALENLEGVTFNMANKIYVKSGKLYKLNSDYVNAIIDTVNTEVEFITLNTEGSNIIDSLINYVTNTELLAVLKPIDLESSARLVLINVNYFMGTWQQTFNRNVTILRKFYVTKQKRVQLPTMTMKARLSYAEDAELGSKILKLDYVGGNVSMYILLPNEIDGINDLVDTIRKDPDAVYRAHEKLRTIEVDVQLPKFKTEIQIDLKAILPKLGVQQIFNPAKSRLDYMLEIPQQLHVSKFIQIAVIEVNETGAEAAAATADVVDLTSIRRPVPVPTFHADHPFLYDIITTDGVTLLSGVFKGN